MDDILLYGRSLEELQKKLEVFIGYWDKKNLKLKPSKMVIGEEVEFAGTVIRAETVENEDVVSILLWISVKIWICLKTAFVIY